MSDDRGSQRFWQIFVGFTVGVAALILLSICGAGAYYVWRAVLP